MSNLRRIMQKIADAQNHSQQIPSSMNGDSVQISEPHLQDYTSKIEQCSEGMLRYEWAWLEEHIEDLELCLVQPEMLKILGGTIQVERLDGGTWHSDNLSFAFHHFRRTCLASQPRQCETNVGILIKGLSIDKYTIPFN
jgi:hypothetical protein